MFILLTLLFLPLLYLSPFLLRAYNQWHIGTICRKYKLIVLSFDDGPGKIFTPILLDFLEANNIKASFFLSGDKILDNKLIIRRMVSFGHAIGCHGYSHLNALKVLPWASIRDIKNGILTLKKAGIECKLFRPPHGKINIFTFIYINLNHLKTCWWTYVSGDTYSPLPCPRLVVDNLIKKKGGVILLHDFDSSEQHMDFVMGVLRLLAENSKKQGFKFITFNEIL